MLVEPYDWLRDIEEELLVRERLHPCPAKGIEEALRQAAMCTPALVLTRWHLPDGTGGDLIEKLHGVGVYARVIGLAGRLASEQHLREAGAYEVLRSPWNAERLFGAIRMALEPKVGP